MKKSEKPDKATRISVDDCLIGASWCVDCEGKKYAEYIYKGNSLCHKHFIDRRNTSRSVIE